MTDKRGNGSRLFTRRQFLRRTGASLAAAAWACGSGDWGFTQAPPEEAADLVLLNGRIITVDDADRVAQAVAVKDGLIQAVGRDADISALAGEATRLIDLGGRAVTPGLVDAHNHLQVMGMMGSYYRPFVPPEVGSLDDLQRKLAEVASQTPEGEWIIGYYVRIDGIGLPGRHHLDPVSTRHPVWLVQQGGHYGSANSLALEMAGIDASTPDPVGGVIGRESNGEPDGVFYNHRAMDLLRVWVPRQTLSAVRQNVVTGQSVMAASGVTSFQDNNVRGTDNVATYLDVGREGEMLLRGSVYYTLEWPGDLERALSLAESYDASPDPFMRFAGFKFLLDGQLTMAYCHEPHNGVRWDVPTWEPQTFKNAVRRLHDTGLQICVHCAGDATVDLVLDAYEEAMEANPRSDPRHRIEHAILTTPEATRRMRDLGVVVSTQPQFIRLGGDRYAEIFGSQRARRVMVTREWLDAGVPVALGSDAPTTPWYTPLATLVGAVARLTPSDRSYEPDQALGIREAIRAHTIGSAFAAHEETVKGSIEVGKMADLSVWSDDPYEASLRQLWNSSFEMSLVGGAIVHQSNDALTPRSAG